MRSNETNRGQTAVSAKPWSVPGFQRWADLIGAGVFAVLFLSLVVQVVRRFVFGAPAAWTEELATIAFVWVIFWGTAFAVPLSDHVAVDFVVPRFAPRIQRALYALVLDWPYGAVYSVFLAAAVMVVLRCLAAIVRPETSDKA